MRVLNTCRMILFTGFFCLLSCKDQPILFTKLSEKETHINFNNTVFESDNFNINTYLYAHNGGGVALADFNNDGLPDIYFTSNQKANQLFLNKGDFQFDDVTMRAGVSGPVGEGIWCTGVTVVDINQDGWLDIYVNYLWDGKMFYGENKLLINKGDGTFEQKAKDYGLDLKGYSQQSVFFDYDNDGDLDMYQLNHSVHDLEVYVKVEKRLERDHLAGDRLFENQSGTYVDVSEEAKIFGGATGYGLSVAIADLDDNGCADIYVSNDFHDNDYVYYNQCDGTFKEDVKNSTSRTSTFSMGSDIADVNNDGLLDIMTLDMKPEDEVVRKKSAGADPYNIYEYKKSFGYNDQFPHNMLQLNRGNLFEGHSQFSEVAQMAGVDATDWSWSVLLADFDNDGAKDIFITNGILRRPNDLNYINHIYNKASAEQKSALDLAKMMPDGKMPNYAYKNIGNLAFENVSSKWGLDLIGCSMGAAYADLDNDGDLDLVVNNLNAPSVVYRNNTESVTENNFLKIKLKGNSKNRNGIGARVILEVSGKKMVQEMNPVRGWLSSSNGDMVFGLGGENTVEKLKVIWYDGSEEKLFNVPSNQTVSLNYQKKLSLAKAPKTEVKLFQKLENDSLKFVHTENHFTDFDVEYLLSHKLSTEGPKMAVGDINNDGLEDIYIGGAKGQIGALYKQIEKNKHFYFEPLNVGFLEPDKEKEDIDAIFLDIDYDGDQDLYIVSGGSHSSQYTDYTDRLYLNNGNEGFFKYEGKLPQSNGAVVEKGDFNKDGYIDLFVGTRSLFGAYGIAPDSYILWNKGSSKTKMQKNILKMTTLKNLGMVTDASWNETESNLVIVGEWMPITFLKFEGDAYTKTTLPNSSGLWNTVYLADLNGDDTLDLLVGNMGLNSSWKATVKEPLTLIVKDWDQNGSVDPLVAYYKEEKQWIFNSLNELQKQMPLVRKRYTNYDTYANDALDKVFSKEDLRSAELKNVQTLATTMYLHKGQDWVAIPLPIQAQMAPVYSFLTADFNSDSFLDIIAVGNFEGFAPSMGKQDVSYGTLLLGEKQGAWKYVEPQKSGFSTKGMNRDIKEIKVGSEQWLFIANNNSKIDLFKINRPF